VVTVSVDLPIRETPKFLKKKFRGDKGRSKNKKDVDELMPPTKIIGGKNEKLQVKPEYEEQGYF